MTDATLRQRAREIARELFDEDIVRPELEFDEPSLRLFAGIIEAFGRQVREDTIQEIADDPDRYKGLKKRIRIQVAAETCEECAKAMFAKNTAALRQHGSETR